MFDSKIWAILALSHIPFLWMNLIPTSIDEAMWSLIFCLTFLACIIMAIAGDDFHPA